jgi:hypothetical protein
MTAFKAKKAYFARVRRSNYLASLRLEGFEVGSKTGRTPLSAKHEVTNSRTAKGTS